VPEDPAVMSADAVRLLASVAMVSCVEAAMDVAGGGVM